MRYQKALLGAMVDSGIKYERVILLSGQDFPVWSKRQIRSYFEKWPTREFIEGMNLTKSKNRRQLDKIVLFHFFRDFPIGLLKGALISKSLKVMHFLPFRKPPVVQLGGKDVDVCFGSDYWALTYPCACFVYEKLSTEKNFENYFRTSYAPSELCVQTIVFNSQYGRNAILYEGEYLGLSYLTPLHYINYKDKIKILTKADLPIIKASEKMFCRKVVSGISDELVETLLKEWESAK